MKEIQKVQVIRNNFEKRKLTSGRACTIRQFKDYFTNAVKFVRISTLQTPLPTSFCYKLSLSEFSEFCSPFRMLRPTWTVPRHIMILVRLLYEKWGGDWGESKNLRKRSRIYEWSFKGERVSEDWTELSW